MLPIVYSSAAVPLWNTIANTEVLSMKLRAFLSHSHSDKPFVEEVATQLGRAAVVYDKFEFSTGDDLKRAILKGIEQSEFFVLFASKSALGRDWVKFEIGEAEKAVAVRSLSGALTYIIEPDLSLGEIPEWMKATLVTRQSSPTLVAKDIRRVLAARLAERRPRYFVGRQNESQEALEILTSFSDPQYRPPLFVFGLNGIGRRSLVQDVGRNSLSYPKTLEIGLREGDLLPELLLRLSTALARQEIINPIEFLKIQILRRSEDVVADIVKGLVDVCSASTLPVIVDLACTRFG